jgi:hypothetical protein
MEFARLAGERTTGCGAADVALREESSSSDSSLSSLLLA